MALKVPHIIVLGHSRGVGVTAYREQIRDTAEEQGFIGRWLALLDDAKVAENDVAVYGQEIAFELASIRSSFAHLESFPFVREREERACSRCTGCTSISAAAG
jgi:carbonic anhydrase